MDSPPTADADDFEVTLHHLANTEWEGDDLTIFVVEVENTTEDVVTWDGANTVFVDDDGFQHTRASVVDTNQETDSDDLGMFDGDETLEVSRNLSTSSSVVPGAKALCVVDVLVPAGRTIQRIVYGHDCEDCPQFELHVSDDTYETHSVPVDELGFADDSGDTAAEPDGEVGQSDPVARSNSFEVELTDIVTGADGVSSDVTLLVFEVSNVGTQSKQWWYDEHIFVDSEGYRLVEAGEVAGRFMFGDDPLPDGFETSPKIPPGATARCYTDVNLPADRTIDRITYEYKEESYEITLDEQTWDDLTIPAEEFSEQRVTVGEDVDERITAMVVEDSPETTFADIGGLEEQKRKIREAIREPLVSSEQFEAIGITPPEGVLLHGPPGTGKTMLARAVANDADATFIKLAAPELARAYLGEGAELVRDCFEYARSKSPAIIFIDEIDAIAARRQGTAQGATEEIYRTMLQLLSEMDGFEEDENVRVLAATNRINRLDSAILRPGRFDRIIEVPRPDSDGLEDIFAVHTCGMNLAADLDIAALARQAEGMSGAEIEAVCTEAGYTAIRDGREAVRHEDFVAALEEIRTEMDHSEGSERYVQ